MQIFLILFFSISVYAVDEFKCEGVRCVKRELVELPSRDTELKLSDFKSGECLINLKSGRDIRIGEVDYSAKSIETFEEEDYILSRKILFFGDSNIDYSMKIVSCSDVSSPTLKDNVEFERCKKTTIQSARNFYCAKPRIKRSPIID